MAFEVLSVTEPLPENEGLANLYKTMIRAFDQFTSENIGALSLDGAKQVVRNGYWSGGPAPFGYSNAKIQNKEGHTRGKGGIVERGTLERNQREAAIVVRAFQIAADTGIAAVYFCTIPCQTHECRYSHFHRSARGSQSTTGAGA